MKKFIYQEVAKNIWTIYTETVWDVDHHYDTLEEGFGKLSGIYQSVTTMARCGVMTRGEAITLRQFVDDCRADLHTLRWLTTR